MRIPIVCMACDHSTKDTNTLLYPVEVRDDGLYQIKCENDHETVIALQEQKFEVLSELGINAIVDGYYREAVANFTSSMERFFEFYIRIICRAHTIDADALSSAWKSVSSSSERQLGAYIFLHLQEEGARPLLLSNSQTQFRNEVVHKGKIPSRDEAIAFGEEVLTLVQKPLDSLKKHHPDQIHSEVMDVMKRLGKMASSKGLQMATMSIPTLISINRSVEDKKNSIQAALERVGSRRW